MAAEERRPKATPAYRAGESPIRPRGHTRRQKTAMLMVLIIIFAATTGFFAYKYHQANNRAKLLDNPKAAASAQIDDLVAKIGKLVILPTDQRPTVATVTDINKLKGQAFFSPAANGDKVLIYTQDKKAVLYRPSQNRVVEIAPLNIGNTNATAGTATSISDSPSSSP